MYTFTHISKKYTHHKQDHPVLENVNLTIQPGEIITIEGPSGIGKSTLLRIIGLIESPNSGTIHIQDSQIHDNNLKFHKKKISTVFQDYALLKNLTVLDNILCPIQCYGLSTNNYLNDLKTIAEELNIDSLLDKPIESLSGGQKQRVAIARALITKPDLLLCDEPTSALDSKNITQLTMLLKTIQKNHNLTIVIVTHDLIFAKSIADRRFEIIDNTLASKTGDAS